MTALTKDFFFLFKINSKFSSLANKTTPNRNTNTNWEILCCKWEEHGNTRHFVICSHTKYFMHLRQRLCHQLSDIILNKQFCFLQSLLLLREIAESRGMSGYIALSDTCCLSHQYVTTTIYSTNLLQSLETKNSYYFCRLLLGYFSI